MLKTPIGGSRMEIPREKDPKKGKDRYTVIQTHKTSLGGALLPILLAIAVLTPFAGQAQEIVRIGGAGGALGSMRLMGAAFESRHPGVRVEIMESLGTSGAIKALGREAIHVGLVARPLSLEEKSLDLSFLEYARTPILFAVKNDSPVSGLSRQDAIQMIDGRVTTWPDGRRARAVLRPASDSETIVIAKADQVLGNAMAQAVGSGGRIVAQTSQEAADNIERIPGAFGLSSLSLIVAERRSLKALSFEGVAPTIDNAARGVYPFVTTYALVTQSVRTPLVESFVEFVRSPEGRLILEESGNFIPTTMD